MGLAPLIVVFKGLAIWKNDERYNQAARFWAKIFGVSLSVSNSSRHGTKIQNRAPIVPCEFLSDLVIGNDQSSVPSGWCSRFEGVLIAERAGACRATVRDQRSSVEGIARASEGTPMEMVKVSKGQRVRVNSSAIRILDGIPGGDIMNFRF